MKKGFTLVELLAVIILLGLLGLIIYPTVTGVINNNKQKLHDKQVEELKRHALSYSSINMSKMRTYNNARNVVTFKDLYDAGIIQNEVVIDPLTDQEMTGCMALTWKNNINNFEVEFSDDCEKYEFTDVSCFEYTVTKKDTIIIKGYKLGCPSDVVIPENIDGYPVASISALAFAPYDSDYDEKETVKLTSVVIPDTVTTINEGAFTENEITKLKLGKNVEKIYGDAFSYNNIVDLVIPDSVTGVYDNAFSNNQITNLTLSKNLTFVSGFSNNNIKEVIIPNGAKYISSHAFKSNKLTNIIIPDGIEYISASAFEDNKLTSVKLGTNLNRIHDYAFKDNNISAIEFPNKLIWIGMAAFQNNKLTSVVIPDSVTTLYPLVFLDNQLTTATIGTGVTAIANNVFNKSSTSNPNLTKIINKSGNPFAWYSVTWCSTSDSSSFVTGTITCADGNIEVTSN